MAPSFSAHQPHPICSSPSLTGWSMGHWVPIACFLAPAVRGTRACCPRHPRLLCPSSPAGCSLPPFLQGRLLGSLPPPAPCSGLQGPLQLAPAHSGPGVAETPLSMFLAIGGGHSWSQPPLRKGSSQGVVLTPSPWQGRSTPFPPGAGLLPASLIRRIKSKHWKM